MPRPSKLTEEIILKAEDLLRHGMSYYNCAWKCGVVPSTFDRWKNKGEKDFSLGIDSIEARFCSRVRAARADLEYEAIAKIRAGDSHDKGAGERWTLERLEWKNWGEKQVAITHEVGLIDDDALVNEILGLLGEE